MKNPCPALALFALLAAVATPGHRLAAQSQHEMTQGAAKDFERADAELNAVYKKVLAALDEVGKDKLVKAQRAWVAFRDAQATFEADEMRGGSAEPMMNYATQAKLTHERVSTLRELISDQPHGKK